jgi:hypothetical protein
MQFKIDRKIMHVGYKVVSVRDDGFGPATTLADPFVRYKIHSLTKREGNNGPFAVFSRFLSACDFMTILSYTMRPNLEILCVLYRRSKAVTLWHGNLATRGRYSILKCPDGTVLADEVLPLFSTETVRATIDAIRAAVEAYQAQNKGV